MPWHLKVFFPRYLSLLIDSGDHPWQYMVPPLAVLADEM